MKVLCLCVLVDWFLMCVLTTSRSSTLRSTFFISRGSYRCKCWYGICSENVSSLVLPYDHVSLWDCPSIFKISEAVQRSVPTCWTGMMLTRGLAWPKSATFEKKEKNGHLVCCCTNGQRFSTLFKFEVFTFSSFLLQITRSAACANRYRKILLYFVGQGVE